MSASSAPTLRLPSVSPTRLTSLPAASPAPLTQVSDTFLAEEADYCQQCRLPVYYDHVAWARGLSDGYTCKCLGSVTPSIPSPPDNTPDETPARPLTPQLARRTVPFVEEEDVYSEVDYSSNKENEIQHPPVGFIHNDPEHPFYYPIYVNNPAYVRTENTWTNERLIIAPYIKYSTDYTMVTGSAGGRYETRTIAVQLAKRVASYEPMTTSKWSHLRRDSDREFAINAAMERINDPRLTGEINRYRGRRETKEILDKMLKDTTERQGKILQELVVVEHDLEQVMRRLERADAYRELESQFRLTFPLPTQPRHYQSPLTEPPVASPMPPRPRGPVEMPILAGEEPKGRRRSRCYRCKSREHKVSQCPARRRNEKCVNCGDTEHRKSKCPFRPLRQSPEPQVISPFAEAVQRPEMTLMERIAMMDKEEWTPPVCGICGKQDPQHTELECSMYEHCTRCGSYGAYGFVRRHVCRPPKNEDEVSLVEEGEVDWDAYQGRD